MTEGLRIIRKKAEESLKDVKKKVCEVRAHIKVLEHMQQEEGLTIKEDEEDVGIDEVGSRGECVSIHRKSNMTRLVNTKTRLLRRTGWQTWKYQLHDSLLVDGSFKYIH